MRRTVGCLVGVLVVVLSSRARAEAPVESALAGVRPAGIGGGAVVVNEAQESFAVEARAAMQTKWGAWEGHFPSLALFVAGPSSGLRHDAAVGLRSAFVSLGASVGEAIGEGGSLDDPHIVGRALLTLNELDALPELVAVVRVYPPTHDYPPSVVAIFYDDHGRPRASIGGPAGGSLTLRGSLFDDERAAPVALSSSLPMTAAASAGALRRRDRELARRAIIFLHPEEHTLSAMEPRRGLPSRTLDSDDFYGALGRPDLVSWLHRRQAGKGALLGGGIATLTAGVITLLANLLTPAFAYGCVEFAGDGSCTGHGVGERNVVPAYAVGGAVTLVGAAAFVGGLLTRAQPVSLPVVRDLVEEYDLELAMDLGVDAASADAWLRANGILSTSPRPPRVSPVDSPVPPSPPSPSAPAALSDSTAAAERPAPSPEPALPALAPLRFLPAASDSPSERGP